METVLDLDGTVYGPSHTLRDAVVPLLEHMLMKHCASRGETLAECRDRLAQKHGTRSRFMQLHLELDIDETELLEVTYVKGVSEVELFLRPGMKDFLVEYPNATILTNAPAAWADFLLQHLAVDQHIKKVVGLRRDFLVEKPAIDAYLEVTSGDAIFVDDIHHNCVTGASLGWTSFWFPEGDAAQSPHENIVRVTSMDEVTAHLKGDR